MFSAQEQANAPDIPLVMTDWYYANADELYTSNPFNDGGTDMQHGTTKHYCGDALKSYDHGVRVRTFGVKEPLKFGLFCIKIRYQSLIIRLKFNR